MLVFNSLYDIDNEANNLPVNQFNAQMVITLLYVWWNIVRTVYSALVYDNHWFMDSG